MKAADRLAAVREGSAGPAVPARGGMGAQGKASGRGALAGKASVLSSAPAGGGSGSRRQGAGTKLFARPGGANALGRRVAAAAEEANAQDDGGPAFPEDEEEKRKQEWFASLADEVALEAPPRGFKDYPDYYGTMVTVVDKAVKDYRAWEAWRKAEFERERKAA